jgi:hypothetical protein
MTQFWTLLDRIPEPCKNLHAFMWCPGNGKEAIQHQRAGEAKNEAVVKRASDMGNRGLRIGPVRWRRTYMKVQDLTCASFVILFMAYLLTRYLTRYSDSIRAERPGFDFLYSQEIFLYSSAPRATAGRT